MEFMGGDSRGEVMINIVYTIVATVLNTCYIGNRHRSAKRGKTNVQGIIYSEEGSVCE